MSAPVKEQDYIVKINAQQEQIATLTKQNEFLQQQVNSLTEILIQMRKDKFGSKSEKTKVLSNQLNMFNEPEAFADPEETEPIAKVHKNGVTVRSHKVRDDALQDLPVEIHEYDLTEDEKIRMCDIVTKSGADYIKTSTGFSTGGATFADIELFAKHVGKNVKIKASGGISSIEDAEKFIELGASRLGTSRIVKIVKEQGDPS